MIDRYSRWPEAVPLPDMLAETVAKAFCNVWVSRFGVPEIISTDQGRQFESELFLEMTRVFGTHRVRTTAYHPQANGLVERFHRTLKAAIMCVDAKHWCDKLPLILLGLRSAVREDINCSVAEMIYGQPIRIPGEFYDTASKDIDRTEFVKTLRQLIQQVGPIGNRNHAKQHVFIPNDLKTCKHVFVRVDTVRRALQHPYDGPFEVIERNDKSVLVFIKGKKQRISLDRVKPAYIYNSEMENDYDDNRKIKVTPAGHRVRFMV
ncbi:uncharacterized protein LOC134216025 [Armigeres subalbatus]|uniref:uncharacterized protein LOC134216025 n=1 Tax=Armigeres subalbatus TaxID=124917 RepID=UPI002ED03BD0